MGLFSNKKAQADGFSFAVDEVYALKEGKSVVVTGKMTSCLLYTSVQGEDLLGEKLSKLATLYLLALKLIYDEQMENVSTSVNVYTTLGRCV